MIQPTPMLDIYDELKGLIALKQLRKSGQDLDDIARLTEDSDEV